MPRFGPTFSTTPLPKYHRGMLIVKVRDELARAPVLARAMAPLSATGAVVAAAAAGAAFASAGDPFLGEGRFDTPGMASLSVLERAGLIRRVTPLARTAPAAGAAPSPLAAPRRAMTALIAAAAQPDRPDANIPTGVCIVELERDADIDELHKSLAADPYVEFASRVPVRYLLARPTARTAATPPSASTMWNLKAIEWAEARREGGFVDADAVKVAVLDTGLHVDHPDLKSRGASYTFAHPDVPTASGQKDIVGHGTHVAGTIAAAISNRVGINGVCNCTLSAWKIFTDKTEFISWDEGFQYVVDPIMYLRALADCIDDNIDVVNLSIGGPAAPDAQESALFEKLTRKGTVVVAAMGNERELGSPTSYPAAIPGVIAVGATTVNDAVTNFSNRGNHIALCAPGRAIWSTLPTYPGQFGFQAVPGPNGKPREGKAVPRETDYAAWDGTSMASPHVAAAAALLVAKHGRVGGDQMRDRLTTTADAVPGMGGKPFHPDYGFGRLNLRRLLA